MRWAKLKTHTAASNNLCACSRITSRNGWHGSGGPCRLSWEPQRRCRCRSSWSTFWTQRWFLENFYIIGLHIVVDYGEIRWLPKLEKFCQTQTISWYGAIVTLTRHVGHLSHSTGKCQWVGDEVNILGLSESFRAFKLGEYILLM